MQAKRPLKFPIRNTLVISGLLVFVIFICYLFLDQRVALLFRHIPYGLIFLGEIISALIEPDYNVLFWPVVFYIVYFIMGNYRAGKRLLFIAISVVMANALVVPVKMAFGRYRPVELFSDGLYGFSFFAWQHAELSFPSGHAVTVSAVAFALACLYPRFFVLWFCFAFVLAFSRILVEAHYLSDILAGMLFSFILVQLIYLSMQRAVGDERQSLFYLDTTVKS